MTDDVMKLFETAFDDFLKAEFRSIVGTVHEQSLCGQLALRLESHKAAFGFAPYHVDTEYDRMLFDQTKKIFRKGESEKIRSDLIVHIVGERDNLIALEMKKRDTSSKGRVAREDDRERLMAMTDPDEEDVHPHEVSRYRLGLFVELDPKKRTWLVEEFRRGQSVGERTGTF